MKRIRGHSLLGPLFLGLSFLAATLLGAALDFKFHPGSHGQRVAAEEKVAAHDTEFLVPPNGSPVRGDGSTKLKQRRTQP